MSNEKPLTLSTKFIYVLPMFWVLCSNDMFYLVIGSDVTKTIVTSLTLFSFLFWKQMGEFMRVWFVCLTAYLLFVMLESMYGYFNRPLVYPHVFAKLFDLFAMFAIYGFYKRFPNKINFGLVSWLIFIFYILYSVTEGRNGYSVSAFAAGDRAFTSMSAYCISIACIYFFNHYFLTKKFISILVFLILAGFLAFAQQRTVWVTTGFSLVVTLLLMKRSNYRIDIGALTPIFILLSVVFMIISSFVVTNKAIMDRLNESVKNFQNSDNDKDGGTAAWRRRQAEAYAPIIEQNLVAGLRLKGMELPNQFHDGGTQDWTVGSGHHFHSFYIDKLFYFGIIGVTLFALPFVIRILTLVFVVRKFLDAEQIATVSYCMTLPVYGISYDIHPYSYAVMGYMFFLLERDSSSMYKTETPPQEAKVTPTPTQVSEVTA
jgi:hypothetical protein